MQSRGQMGITDINHPNVSYTRIIDGVTYYLNNIHQVVDRITGDVLHFEVENVHDGSGAFDIWNLPELGDIKIVIPQHTIEKIKEGVKEMNDRA